MKSLKWWFVALLFTITMFVVLLLADVIVMGLISLIISIFSKTQAIQVFKNGVPILLLIETILTIPVVAKSRKEGDK